MLQPKNKNPTSRFITAVTAVSTANLPCPVSGIKTRKQNKNKSKKKQFYEQQRQGCAEINIV